MEERKSEFGSASEELFFDQLKKLLHPEVILFTTYKKLIPCCFGGIRGTDINSSELDKIFEKINNNKFFTDVKNLLKDDVNFNTIMKQVYGNKFTNFESLKNNKLFNYNKFKPYISYIKSNRKSKNGKYICKTIEHDDTLLFEEMKVFNINDKKLRLTYSKKYIEDKITYMTKFLNSINNKNFEDTKELKNIINFNIEMLYILKLIKLVEEQKKYNITTLVKPYFNYISMFVSMEVDFIIYKYKGMGDNKICKIIYIEYDGPYHYLPSIQNLTLTEKIDINTYIDDSYKRLFTRFKNDSLKDFACSELQNKILVRIPHFIDSDLYVGLIDRSIRESIKKKVKYYEKNLPEEKNIKGGIIDFKHTFYERDLNKYRLDTVQDYDNKFVTEFENPCSAYIIFFIFLCKHNFINLDVLPPSLAEIEILYRCIYEYILNRHFLELMSDVEFKELYYSNKLNKENTDDYKKRLNKEIIKVDELYKNFIETLNFFKYYMANLLDYHKHMCDTIIARSIIFAETYMWCLFVDHFKKMEEEDILNKLRNKTKVIMDDTRFNKYNKIRTDLNRIIEYNIKIDSKYRYVSGNIKKYTELVPDNKKEKYLYIFDEYLAFLNMDEKYFHPIKDVFIKDAKLEEIKEIYFSKSINDIGVLFKKIILITYIENSKKPNLLLFKFNINKSNLTNYDELFEFYETIGSRTEVICREEEVIKGFFENKELKKELYEDCKEMIKYFDSKVTKDRFKYGKLLPSYSQNKKTLKEFEKEFEFLEPEYNFEKFNHKRFIDVETHYEKYSNNIVDISKKINAISYSMGLYITLMSKDTKKLDTITNMTILHDILEPAFDILFLTKNNTDSDNANLYNSIKQLQNYDDEKYSSNDNINSFLKNYIESSIKKVCEPLKLKCSMVIKNNKTFTKLKDTDEDNDIAYVDFSERISMIQKVFNLLEKIPFNIDKIINSDDFMAEYDTIKKSIEDITLEKNLDQNIKFIENYDERAANSTGVPKNTENTEVDKENTEVDKENTEVDKENTEVDKENTEVDKENTEVDKENTEVDKENKNIKIDCEIIEDEDNGYPIIRFKNENAKVNENIIIPKTNESENNVFESNNDFFDYLFKQNILNEYWKTKDEQQSTLDKELKIRSTTDYYMEKFITEKNNKELLEKYKKDPNEFNIVDEAIDDKGIYTFNNLWLLLQFNNGFKNIKRESFVLDKYLKSYYKDEFKPHYIDRFKLLYSLSCNLQESSKEKICKDILEKNKLEDEVKNIEKTRKNTQDIEKIKIEINKYENELTDTINKQIDD